MCVCSFLPLWYLAVQQYIIIFRWKDLNCPFRKDPRTRLMVIPTLIKWQHPQKLEGEQCENPDLVELLFTDEDC